MQLANPKAAVFMIAFYPQFVPSDQPLFATTALLALLQVSIELCFYLTLAAFVARAGAWFRRLDSAPPPRGGQRHRARRPRAQGRRFIALIG